METVGDAAINALQKLTDSSQRSGGCRVSATKLRAPRTDQEAHILKEWADKQPPFTAKASVDQIGQHLDFIRTVLPSKNNDQRSGEMRATVYASILSDFTNDALAFMANRACRELDWFPTPRQCLEILREWQEPVSAKERANSLCLSYWQGRFDEFLAALEDGSATMFDVEKAQDRWKRIAEERGLLRRMDDGSYVIRAKWQGPRKPASIEAAKEREPRRYCKTCLFSSENPATKECRAPNCGLNQNMEQAA